MSAVEYRCEPSPRGSMSVVQIIAARGPDERSATAHIAANARHIVWLAAYLRDRLETARD